MKNEVKLSGVKLQHKNTSQIDSIMEVFSRKGCVVVKNIFDEDEICRLQTAYDRAKTAHLDFYRKNDIDLTKRERGIIRQIYSYEEIFLESVTKAKITDIVDSFLEDDWIITQQNGSHVDAQKQKNKDGGGVQVWHRDFVFRHVTTSKPLLMNILIPLDKFTKENGATNVLPYSHLFPEFPSEEFLLQNIEYAEANIGDIIVLNGLTYHAAGQNLDQQNRRSVNTVFAIPAMRHQVDPIPQNASNEFLRKYKRYLTAGYENNPSLIDFLRERNA